MSLTPDMMPAWELREHLKDRDASIVILGDEITYLRAEVERMREVLKRTRTVLGNMALENEGAVFNRWPINHEPLRSDAKHLLPIIDAALTTSQEPPNGN